MRATRIALTLLAIASVVLFTLALARPSDAWDPRLATLTLGDLHQVSLGLHVGLVESVLLMLVCVVGAVVATYSARNLVGQNGLRRYAALQLLTVTSLALTVAASSLPAMALSWSVATLGLSALVGHAATVQARAAAAQVRARLLLGDALLWCGVVAVGTGVGTWERGELSGRVEVAAPGAVTLAAVLLVSATIVRSALVPAHRWLPETSAAPSPVSALLHAGFVNGVGVLSLLTWPLVQASTPVRVLLLVVGACTVVVGTAHMRTRGDLKSRLAASTSSQMGYLAVQVGLGLPAAVLAHVVGHGLWKASLFLGAGNAVERARRRGAARVRRLPLGQTVALVTISVAVTVGAATVALPWGRLVSGPAELVPVALASSVAAVGLVAVWRRRDRVAVQAISSLVVLAVASAYVVALRALGAALEPTFGEPAQPWGDAPAWLVLSVAVILVLGAVTSAMDSRLRAGSWTPLARWAARRADAPRPIIGRLRPTPRVALPAVGLGDPQTGRTAVGVGAATVAPLWPLTAFVAGNPLAGLESLAFRDAVSLAADAWRARSGPTAAMLHHALEEGRVDGAAFDALPDGPSITLVGRTASYRSVVRDLLLADADLHQRAAATSVLSGVELPVVRRTCTPMESVAADVPEPVMLRTRQLASSYCLRALGGLGWPLASSPWQELRHDVRVLDSLVGVAGAGTFVAALPDDPGAAVDGLLSAIALDPRDRPKVLARLLARDPGWPAHASWRDRHQRLGDPDLVGPTAGDELLVEITAVRLALDLVVASAYAERTGRRVDGNDLVACAPAYDEAAAMLAVTCTSLGVRPESLSRDDVERWVTLAKPWFDGGLDTMRAQVLEAGFRAPLLDQVGARARSLGDALTHPSATSESAGPDAQVVMCIDIRSERMRRHLEHVGPWETFGAAGFFGLPVRHISPAGVISERTPALLRPSRTVTEDAPQPGSAESAIASLGAGVFSIESSPAVPLGWAECAGWGVGVVTALATWRPSALVALRHKLFRHTGDVSAVIDVISTGSSEHGVPLGDVVDAAEAFLRSTGLQDLAPVLVLCGHGASAANNPHVAAYDCGACGGASGDVSARTMATALNDQRVRAALRERGLTIPSDLVVVPAVHDTTTDDVELLHRDHVSKQALERLDRLEADLAQAGAHVRAERVPTLPDAPRASNAEALHRHVIARGRDWAQPRPEWGLAGAASIIIGPRSLTTHVDLDGRVFLQSYRPDADPDGSSLEQLLTAPLVVAQWITSQYWSSTIDPGCFGAGDKTTHNVVGDGTSLSAVVTGPRGDLRTGLPWQAVSASAPTGSDWSHPTKHAPMRLLAVVCADPDVVETILARQPSLAQLVTGSWITLCVVEPGTGRTLRRTDTGHWVEDRRSGELPHQNKGDAPSGRSSRNTTPPGSAAKIDTRQSIDDSSMTRTQRMS